MSRGARLVLACLAGALTLLPLAVKKPGLPMQPRQEEPTWYLMAASLGGDGDLAAGPEDLRRLFDAWPFATAPTLELAATAANADAVVFARPVLYPLLAAPWAALFGANGPVALNLLLLCAAIAAGAVWLAGADEDGPGLLFAAGFFLVAAPFAWAFVIAPETFTLAAVTCGLVLAWRPEAAGRPASPRRALAAGALLAAAVYQQPWSAPLALAPCALWLAERKPRPALAWLGGAAAMLAVLGALALYLTGAVHPALGLETRTVAVADPLGQPPLPELVRTAPAATPEPTTARLGDFLWGRHMGLLPYFSWLLPALFLFARDGRRCRRRLALAAALALALALVWLAAPLASQAGGDAIGNRLLVALYPAFLLLVRATRPAWPTLGGYALGGVLLGGLLFVPFGAPVAEGTFQSHTRNRPLAALPLELALLPHLPDYQAVELGEGLRLWSRRDQVQTRGAELAVLGGDPNELWLDAPTDLGSALLVEVESEARPNAIELDFAGVRSEVKFDTEPASTERLELNAPRPSARRRLAGEPRSLYRLDVVAERGARAGWDNPERAGRGSAIGAKLLFLGPAEWLERDVFHAEWLGCGAPRVVRAGEEFLALARLRNTSGFAWPTAGAAWVRLSYHWLDAAGAQVSYNGARTELARPVAPGEALETWQKVTAPAAAGEYLLELDPVFERVAWFSTRGVATCRQPVTIEPAELPTGTVSAAPSGR